ncbi:MAG: multicopper oxidase domain-containing protein [Bacteroidia bacterium]
MNKFSFLVLFGFFNIANFVLAQNPLFIPDTLAEDTFHLNLQAGTSSFFPGINTSTLGVNGNLLGPTLIMNQGQEVQMMVKNHLPDTTTIHWHGMHVSSANDGGPHTYILSNATWSPRFTVLDKAGTYWYHPHLHKKTNEHVSKGIAGLIIVRDNEEANINLPRDYGVDDFPIIIQTKSLDANHEIITQSVMDTLLLVNGTVNPFLNVPAQVIRLRLLNGSSERVYQLGFSSNIQFYQIASDGGLLSQALPMTRLRLAPGERAEILLDLSNAQNQTHYLRSFSSELQQGVYGANQVGMGMANIAGYNSNPLNGADFDILQLNVGVPTQSPVTQIPSTLASVVSWDENAVNVLRNLTFSPAGMGPTGMVNGPFQINGAFFEMNTINQTVNLNDIEIWTLFNQSMVAHPFHIHDVQFYLLDRNGVTVAANEQGRKDVVLVHPMETVRFITKFEDFADSVTPYMYHCHMLTHEDEGMMGQFVVIDQTTSIESPLDKKGINVYPNPVNQDYFFIESVNGDLIRKLEIYDLQGRLILRQHPNQSSVKIFVDGHVSSGAYFLKIFTNYDLFTRKVFY